MVFGATGYIGRFNGQGARGAGLPGGCPARERSGIGGRQSRTRSSRCREQKCASGMSPIRPRSRPRPSTTRDVVELPGLPHRGPQGFLGIDHAATSTPTAGTSSRGGPCSPAICVQKALLEFQKAKLASKPWYRRAGDDPLHRSPLPSSKSGGAGENCRKGGPYVMFGGGTSPAANRSAKPTWPGSWRTASMTRPSATRCCRSRTGPALMPGSKEMLFRALNKPQRMLSLPIALMDAPIALLEGLARLFPGINDTAEFGRIGRYYASESMASGTRRSSATTRIPSYEPTPWSSFSSGWHVRHGRTGSGGCLPVLKSPCLGDQGAPMDQSTVEPAGLNGGAAPGAAASRRPAGQPRLRQLGEPCRRGSAACGP